MNKKEDIDSLIETMKAKGNLTSERVEKAMRKVPRHLFVSSKDKEKAYTDSPLSIGHGQTISQPSVVAKMTEFLDVKEGDRILEIGAGSGWQSAVLSRLVGSSGKVYTVELIEGLAKNARENINKAGIDNVEVVFGDGSIGLQKYAPYDSIICTAVSPEIQDEWVEQLKVGGRLVTPLGEIVLHSLVVFEKKDDGLDLIKKERGYRFVKLRGTKGF